MYVLVTLRVTANKQLGEPITWSGNCTNLAGEGIWLSLGTPKDEKQRWSKSGYRLIILCRQIHFFRIFE